MNDSTWTWLSGNIGNNTGVYGEKGKASPNNHPGARREAVGLYDSLREEFWLFGGNGLDYKGEFGSCGQSLHQSINSS